MDLYIPTLYIYNIYIIYIIYYIHTHNNINSQLDATITNFINNYNQLNMFRVIISPILRRTRLWYNAPAILPAVSIAGALYHKL